jgi:thiamine biosynthesis lipoprotein
MGTLCRIELFGGTSELNGRLFARLEEIDRMMSVNRPDSEISRINAFAGLERVPVSPGVFTVLERARYFAGVSDGAFDPTIGPLVRLWGIGGDAPRIPMPDDLRTALELVNWRDLELRPSDGAGGTAFLLRKGMELDLGAIAKGFAADQLAALLKGSGVRAAVIDLGGNIYVYGTKPAGFPLWKTRAWRIGVQDPGKERGVYAGYVETGEGSVVTSGIYERFFTENGKRRHHILDTALGFPVENGLMSVTIMAQSSMDADALSTAVFALGYDKGRALAEAHNARALFIFEDGVIRGSAGALDAFTLTGTSFRIDR